ncbi:MAG: DUF721 domain-containing protein [Sulfuricella sp.]|nr:DUF721 domain-containing protein [Sulfuricella sp.]
MVQETRKIAAIQRAWERSAPTALLDACHAGPLHQGTLTIFADNGAVAAKLKQQTARLTEKLRQAGVEVTSIRFEVQADSGAPPAKPAKDIAIGQSGLEELGHLAESLEDSPLKTALARLVRRHSKPV